MFSPFAGIKGDVHLMSYHLTFKAKLHNVDLLSRRYLVHVVLGSLISGVWLRAIAFVVWFVFTVWAITVSVANLMRWDTFASVWATMGILVRTAFGRVTIFIITIWTVVLAITPIGVANHNVRICTNVVMMNGSADDQADGRNQSDSDEYESHRSHCCCSSVQKWLIMMETVVFIFILIDWCTFALMKAV